MFGTYRTLLALMVVAVHLGDVPVLGGYAVFGFYTLSGYLMTLIMQRSYGYTVDGVSRYALNRFLRIYPIYWVSLLLSVGAILLVGEGFARRVNVVLYFPDDVFDTLRNVFLVFFFREAPRLTPPAWALTVEVFFYVCIGLGLSRTRRLTLVWFGASVVYHLIVNLLGLGWPFKYFSLAAASLPFATGALAYHYRREVLHALGRFSRASYVPVLLFLLMLVNWAVGYWTDNLRGIFFYSNYVINVFLILVLSEKRTLPYVSKTFDGWMGDFSYPIYLTHYQIGVLLLVLAERLEVSLSHPSAALVWVSLPFLFLVSWLMTRFVERPVESVRSRVKRGLAQPPAGQRHKRRRTRRSAQGGAMRSLPPP